MGSDVFISAVSGDFRDQRALLAEGLRDKVTKVVTQEDISKDTTPGMGDTIMGKLHKYIEGCTTVVGLLGGGVGTTPEPLEASGYVNRYGAEVPAELLRAGVSYTQWEVVFAVLMDHDLLLCQDVRKTDLVASQAVFLDWLMRTHGRYAHPFENDQQLAELVLDREWQPAEMRSAGHRYQHHPDGGRLVEAGRPAVEQIELAPAKRLVKDQYAMVGRDAELDRLANLLRVGGDPLVNVTAPVGAGKKKLLSALEEPTLISKRADRRHAEDLLQDAWSQLYAAEGNAVLPDERLDDLAEAEVLVFMADVDPVAPQISTLTETMEEARFCVTSSEPVPAARAFPLEELTDESLRELFEQRYLSRVSDGDWERLSKLCHRLDRNPARVVQLAEQAYAASDLVAFVDGLAGLEHTELLASLTPAGEPGRAASIVARVGTFVPETVLADVTSLSAVGSGESTGVLRSASPRYEANLALGLVPADDDVMSSLFDATRSWLAIAATDEIFENREFVEKMLQWGEDNERWPEVVEMARAADAAMVLGGRHGAWEEILERAQRAASASADGAAEAWALHQLGTRSLLVGNAAGALGLLQRARRRRGQDAGAGGDSTLQNLKQLPFAAVAVLLLIGWAALVGIWLFALGVDASADEPEPPSGTPAISEISPEVGEFDSAGVSRDFLVKNLGGAPFSVAVSSNNETPGFSVDAGSCSAPLAPESDCTISIVFRPEGPNVAAPDSPIWATELVLVLTADDDSAVIGDRRILLIGDAGG